MVNSGEAPLIIALKRKEYNKVSEIERVCDGSGQTPYGETAADLAIRWSDHRLAENLLEKGVGLHVRVRNYIETERFWTVVGHGCGRVAELMIEKKDGVSG